MDQMLPFGLRSAPQILNAGAVPALARSRARLDFIVVRAPGSAQCADAVTTLDRACEFLGVPIAEQKRDGLTTCLVYLGIEVDTIKFQLCLPKENWTASSSASGIGVIVRHANNGNRNP